MPDIDATDAVLCSYLGLSARDLAEIGSFSERFARDLLAGRRPFPRDVQVALHALYADLAKVRQVMFEQVEPDDPTIYIFRTLEQLRSSPIGMALGNAYLGPYRVAAFQVMESCIRKKRPIRLVFAKTPRVPGEIDV